MLSLLAQRIPGYFTDDPSPGGSLFSTFYSYFIPNWTDFSLGRLIFRLLVFSIISAGLFFFVKLILAGYNYLTSLGEPAKIQAAAKNLTNAAIGLIVVISAYFLAQILQVVLGIDILS